MRRFSFAPSAETDLDSILSHIRVDNQIAAERWFSQLEEKCDTIAHSPLIGKIREDLSPGLYMFPFGKYLIFYEARPSGIEIVHIVHGARDVARFLSPEPGAS